MPETAKPTQPPAQHLTLPEVLLNVQCALDEGRLQAQLAPGRGCKYSLPDRPGCGCAIGVSLRPDVLKYLTDSDKQDRSVLFLKNTGVIETSSDEDLRILRELQSTHDAWTQNAEASRRVYELAFRRLLAQLLIKHAPQAGAPQ